MPSSTVRDAIRDRLKEAAEKAATKPAPTREEVANGGAVAMPTVLRQKRPEPLKNGGDV
jgi:hypothetical protein